MGITAAAAHDLRERREPTQKPTFGLWTCSAGLAQNWFLVFIFFILFCFNWFNEIIDVFQEKGRKRKRKGPRLLLQRHRESNRAPERPVELPRLGYRKDGEERGYAGFMNWSGGLEGGCPDRGLVNWL